MIVLKLTGALVEEENGRFYVASGTQGIAWKETIMYWNYRVVEDKYPNSGESYFEICEVHYDENNVPTVWGEVMAFESLEDLKEGYEYLMKTAFERPVLKVVDGKLVEVPE